jgi:hypothetical protein
MATIDFAGDGWQALALAMKPRILESPNPNQHYPYNIHETDGLSRNPDDCMRWGCIVGVMAAHNLPRMQVCDP